MEVSDLSKPTGPMIQVPNIQSHHQFFKNLFLGNTQYAFGDIVNNQYGLRNLANGKMLNFRQLNLDEDYKVDLVRFLCLDEYDLAYRHDRVIPCSGSHVAPILEIAPHHFSAWYKTPCDWTFGLTFFRLRPKLA